MVIDPEYDIIDFGQVCRSDLCLGQILQSELLSYSDAIETKMG